MENICKGFWVPNINVWFSPFIITFDDFSQFFYTFFLLFFYLFKKPKIFFAKIFIKGKKLHSFFLLMGQIELLHFDTPFLGFSLYFFFIALYTFLFLALKPLYFYVLCLIIKYIIFFYISFRACFLSPNNPLIRELFTEFNNLSNKLQQSKVAKNRIFFLQLYFLFCLIVLWFGKKHINDI